MRDRDRRSSSSRPTRPGPALLLTLAACWMSGGRALASDPVAAPPRPNGPVLRLADGGFVGGELGRSRGSGLLRWHGSAFGGPFDFRLVAVEAVRWPAPEDRPEPNAPDCVELTTDDVLFGTVVGLDEDGATLETPDLGRLRIARGFLRRIDRRRGDAAPVYFGPSTLSEWTASPGPDSWSEDAGHLRSEVAGAGLRLDVGMPSRAAVEVELSWERKPSFILALGVGDDEDSLRRAFRFEVWGPDLVALRETDRKAEIAWIGTLDEGPGRIRLRAFLDQEAGRLDLAPSAGIASAAVALIGPDDRPLPGVFLGNVRGDVRLERLVVRRWDGTPPPELPPDTPCVVRDDGSLAIGTAARLDTDEGSYVVRSGDEEARVPADRASVLIFSTSTVEPPRDVVLSCHDGRRLSGTLLGIGPEAIGVVVPGIDGPLSVPIAALQSLSVPGRAEPLLADGEPTGTLELDGVRLRGHLTGAEADDDAPARLAWRPVGSGSAGPLRPEAAGRIVYKQPPQARGPRVTTVRPVAVNRVAAGQVVVMDQRVVAAERIGGAIGGAIRSVLSPFANTPGGRLLLLRSGDVIPAEVLAIDEEGVHFQSDFSERRFVAHDRIRGLSFAPVEESRAELTEPDRDRLLTLPRLQRGNPPTHLIRSRNGDYLRGRLIGMDSHWLRVEVRLGERRLPRAVLSEIVWLDPGDESGADPAEIPEREPGGLRVLAVRGDGVRLTFIADRVEDSTLVGLSDVLGEFRVPLDKVDQLVIGAAIDDEAAREEGPGWALRDAPDPQFVRDDGEGGGSPGTESAMVGAPAPEFALDLLDGEPFRLADHRGEVVVLDFWATWCGPCLQAMPEVERVAEEFRDRGVRLVAVNLQEGPEQIAATLRRHRLDVAVALDRDGAVAARYGVTAIPQTVVIDRDGAVARLFVGGGPRLGDQLREAIRDLTADRGPDDAGD